MDVYDCVTAFCVWGRGGQGRNVTLDKAFYNTRNKPLTQASRETDKHALSRKGKQQCFCNDDWKVITECFCSHSGMLLCDWTVADLLTKNKCFHTEVKISSLMTDSSYRLINWTAACASLQGAFFHTLKFNKSSFILFWTVSKNMLLAFPFSNVAYYNYNCLSDTAGVVRKLLY